MTRNEDEFLQAQRIIETARSKGIRLATAESCTGGLVAAALTAVAGASEVFERGFVTYSNNAKVELLDVPQVMLDEHGAVSEPVAISMAVGALRRSKTQIAVSVTGVAGPGGGSGAKPVGLVHFGVASVHGVKHRTEHFGDLGRDTVRSEAVKTALHLLEIALTAFEQKQPEAI